MTERRMGWRRPDGSAPRPPRASSRTATNDAPCPHSNPAVASDGSAQCLDCGADITREADAARRRLVGYAAGCGYGCALVVVLVVAVLVLLL